MVLKTARRYAHAYLQIAIEQNKLERILKDVYLIHNTVENSRELELFMKSPIIKPDDKRIALQSLFEDKIDLLTNEFLKLVVRKGRENLLDQIMLGFIEQYKVHKGIVDIEVHTASEISEDQTEKLKKALEKVTEKSVELTFHEDSELIGGLAVRIEDTVIDGTIKHKIDRLRSLFKQPTV